MNQDLVFCDGQHQQSGCVLWAQIQQQRGEAPTTAAQNQKSLLTEAAINWASAFADCIFNEVSPTLKEVGRTRVGLATDCHAETAVEDRRRALVQVCMDLTWRLRRGNDEGDIKILSSNFTFQTHLH